MTLGTSADSDSFSAEFFRKFFLAAQEFKEAAVKAGGIEKLKQDTKFKSVPSQTMEFVYGVGKALEDLPNPDLAARDFMSSAQDFATGVVETGQKAWNSVKGVCETIVSWRRWSQTITDILNKTVLSKK